ncbi:MAG: M28 family peptidase [Eubacteriales bacterium]
MKRKLLSICLTTALIMSSISPAFAGSYTVKSGDVLWKIASQYGTTWQELAKLNKLNNPNLIFPNQIINTPEKTTPIPVPPIKVPDVSKVEKSYADYVKSADVKYAYNIADQLSSNPEFFNSDLGGRNSGSDAEHRAADFLAQKMTEIGLKDVSKDAFNVAKWQFNGSTLTIDGDKTVIKPYSYASGGTSPEGISNELVYVGQGTAPDYANIDVKGKIVLVDINQRANWWVTLPTLEASLKGASAILTVQRGGFAEIASDALNSQDMCGPVTIPSLSISAKDGDYLIALTKKGIVNVNLKVDNIVEPGGTSYNIVGEIPGKNPNEMVIVGDHYDAHFLGFQDNGCAVGLTLAIAKGMIDSNYKPERTIVFILHGSEEYGAINSASDWSIGAWNQVFKIHPEWVGKALTYINFELPAYEFEKVTRTDSAPELQTFITDFAKNNPNAPQPVGVFPGGVVPGLDTYTYSDDFSYQMAGIPSAVNGFLFKSDNSDVNDFYYKIYHSQYDNKSTYNEAALKYNLKYYGSLAMAIDQSPSLELDFTKQYDRMSTTFNADIAKAAGADVISYQAALTDLKTSATTSHNETMALNKLYKEKLAAGATEEVLAPIWEAAMKANKVNLEAFKMVSDNFIMTSAGTSPIVGHEYYQNNISYMVDSIDSLKKGDVNNVVDNLLWQVNGLINYYAYSFDKEVVDHMYAQLHNNKGNLYWSTGKVMQDADVYDLTLSLNGKYGTKGDFSDEISKLQVQVANQQILLKDIIAKETMAAKAITAKLKEINLSEALN